MKDLKKIMLIGVDSPLTDAIRKQIEDVGREIVIVPSKPERSITINGKSYIEKEEAKHNSTNSRYLMESLAIAMCHSVSAQMDSRKGPPPNVNIVTEFELIQQKKSNLSKSQRDWVVKQFNNRFKEL